MELVPVAKPVRDGTHFHFRLCVNSADERHPLTALAAIKCVHRALFRGDGLDHTINRKSLESTGFQFWRGPGAQDNVGAAAELFHRTTFDFHRHPARVDANPTFWSKITFYFGQGSGWQYGDPHFPVTDIDYIVAGGPR